MSAAIEHPTLCLADLKSHIANAKQSGLGKDAEVFIYHAHNYGDEADLDVLRKWWGPLCSLTQPLGTCRHRLLFCEY